MSYLGELNQTCTIERNTPSIGTAGVVTEGWAVVVTNEPCKLVWISGQSQFAQMAEQLDCDYILLLNGGVNIQPEMTNGIMDRVTINSVYYLVKFVSTQTERWSQITAYLKRIA